MTRLALVSLAGLALSCAGSEADCTSDNDCREGFRCDLQLYKGDCVQKVYVTACGDTFCQWPYQGCSDGVCVDLRDGGVLPDASGMGGAGGMGMGGGVVPDPDMGRGGGGGDRPPADMSVEVEEPSVLIESPLDGALFIDEDPEVSGQVLRLAPSGRVSMRVDGGEPERIEASDTGRFTVRPRLKPGPHTVTIIAEQGGHYAEAGVSLRVDFFIRSFAGELRAGESRFDFVGLNSPNLLQLAHAHLADGDVDRVSEVFREARALGVTVVRTRAYDDRPMSATAIQTARGVHGEAGLAALDHVVAKAGENSVKLILSLAGTKPDYGGIAQYLAWGGYLAPIPDDRRFFFLAGEIREHLKDHVRFMLGHRNPVTGLDYADDPAIMAWEILDEADATGLFAGDGGVATNEFFGDLTAVVKGAAPKQMVTTGDTGFDVNPNPYGRHYDPLRDAGVTTVYDGSHGIAWQRNTRLQTNDIAVIHVDAQALGLPVSVDAWSNLGAAWIRGHASLASVESKPLVVLVGKMASGPLQLAQRRMVMQAWLDEVVSLGIDGFIVGNFYADGTEAGDVAGWSWRDGTEPADMVNQYADLVQGLTEEE